MTSPPPQKDDGAAGMTPQWEALERASDGTDPAGQTYRPESFAQMSFDADTNTAVVMKRLSEQPTPTLPRDDFTITTELGRGGMGIVYRARQGALERSVAVKRMRDDLEGLVGPFVAEAQVLGRLEHPGIVPVHALRAGDDGAPLLAMKLLEGQTWDALIGKADEAEHLRIFTSVCNAVAFAHSRSILHRDLKPANVMVGDFGQVYLMDWGIAVALDEAICEDTAIVHHEQADAPAGTPAYMPPELARGDGNAQDARTDVYQLGACLHEALTGQRRHVGDTLREILLSAVASKPIPYPDRFPDVAAELGDICNRATARDPDDRFASVGELIDAVAHYEKHRDANDLVRRATEMVGPLREEVESERDGHLVHELHAEVRFALKHALEIHPESTEAKTMLANVAALMLNHALTTRDLPLAERLLEMTQRDEDEVRVATLREELSARERELDLLREDAQLRDWSAVARPLAWCFTIAGLLGAAGSLATSWTLNASLERPHVPVFVIWSAICVLSGVAARLLLHGRDVPKNIVSPKIFGLWAAVAIACVVTGTVSQLDGHAPFTNAGYQSAMVAIGFSAMAFQTRLWLLVPAAMCFLGSFAMPPNGSHNAEIFGLVWGTSMITVGVALRAGARLSSPQPIDG